MKHRLQREKVKESLPRLFKEFLVDPVVLKDRSAARSLKNAVAAGPGHILTFVESGLNDQILTEFERFCPVIHRTTLSSDWREELFGRPEGDRLDGVITSDVIKLSEADVPLINPFNFHTFESWRTNDGIRIRRDPVEIWNVISPILATKEPIVLVDPYALNDSGIRALNSLYSMLPFPSLIKVYADESKSSSLKCIEEKLQGDFDVYFVKEPMHVRFLYSRFGCVCSEAGFGKGQGHMMVFRMNKASADEFVRAYDNTATLIHRMRIGTKV